MLVVERILEKEQDEDWWDNLPVEVKHSVEIAIVQIDEGKGIPHDVIKQRYPEWFKR